MDSSPNDGAALPRLGSPVLRYLFLIAQLLLLLKVLQVFHIEERRRLLPLMCVAASGFVIHHRLPAALRLPFFVLVSVIGFAVVLGVRDTAVILAVGGLLIGACHLPLSRGWRAVLVLGLGILLASMRWSFPWPFWPILGSLFMFRLLVYLAALTPAQPAATWSQRCAYFFLLPNACFPFFPIVDYRTFLATYRNEDDDLIAQRGITWILRGTLHLIAYRLVKYQWLPPPEDILNVQDFVLFLAMNYALYLRISGTFHLITGTLLLFGFNLPRTHDNYFLADSFTDIWRRINIYWKEFLAQHVFFPCFLRFRFGKNPAARIAVAVVAVFLSTWLLHSYQVFWLLGDFPLAPREAALWLAAGTVVAASAMLDYRSARRRTQPSTTISLSQAFRRSLRILFVFLSVSVFWACWSQPAVFGVLTMAREKPTAFANGWFSLLLWASIAVGTGSLVQWIGGQRENRLNRHGFTSWERQPWPVAAICCLLLVAAYPGLPEKLPADTARVLASLQVDYPTTLELARSVPGYYEALSEANLQSDPLFDAGRARQQRGQLLYSDITRPRNDLLELELIPRWRGELAGARMTINRWGMREGPIERDKAAGTWRIAVVGSSVVMGYGVEDQEVFTELLEARLNASRRGSLERYELLNFGAGRYYALHIAAALREKVFAFQPDAVFYIAHQGELYGVVPHVAKFSFQRAKFPFPCLNNVIAAAGVTPETSWGSTQTLLQSQAQPLTRCIYQGIVSDCRERGIVPAYFYAPMPGVVEVSLDPRTMLALAEEAGFLTFDVSNWAEGFPPGEVKLSAGDHHANRRGHELLADHIYRELESRPEWRNGR